MSTGSRVLSAALFVVAVFGAGRFLLTEPEPAASSERTDPVARRFQSAQECRACHEDVWDEWYGSHHQIAYLNTEVRALSDDFRNKECQACHLPQPIEVTGFGQRTLPRKTRPDEGVGCIECHVDGEGRVMGTRDLPDAPCAPRAREEMADVVHCESCHNQHWTTDQWRASSYPEMGVGCNDCHMPEVERQLANGATRVGRGHGYAGAHDTAMLKKAGTFTVTREAGELVLVLENTGAGHNFPTEERHRVVDIEYRFVAADGSEGAWERAYRFRQPYRDEPGENTQLAAGARHESRVTIPDGTARAEARLWYRLKPYIGDDDPASTLLEEREVVIE
jgi:uncharacterized protein with PIN domain